MQEEILDKNPDADVKVYAVWFNMLAGDRRDRWDATLMPDDRVTNLWDEGRIISRWYAQAEKESYPFGSFAWDIYYLYDTQADWNDKPQPLLSSGFTVYGERFTLQDAILPLLDD